MNNLVFLAGGIGVAPFYSVIRNAYLEKSPKKMALFYSNRTKKAIAFFKGLNNIAKNWPSFKLVYVVTREKVKNKEIREFSRLNGKTIKKHLRNLKNRNYFIC